jgi:hypothetical protein
MNSKIHNLEVEKFKEEERDKCTRKTKLFKNVWMFDPIWRTPSPTIELYISVFFFQITNTAFYRWFRNKIKLTVDPILLHSFVVSRSLAIGPHTIEDRQFQGCGEELGVGMGEVGNYGK